MKLYYTPGVCSIGIHVLLELVKLMEGAQYKPDFKAVSAKSKVPVLVLDDGAVLTEYTAIAWYLAASHPAAGLLPTDPLAQARVLEALDYAVATAHMQGFTRIFRPGNFAPSEADAPAVKARGAEMVAESFAVLAATLGGKDYLAGAYSIADTALFYLSFWAIKRMGQPVPESIAAHFARMLARPAVARVMTQEGLAG